MSKQAKLARLATLVSDKHVDRNEVSENRTLHKDEIVGLFDTVGFEGGDKEEMMKTTLREHVREKVFDGSEFLERDGSLKFTRKEISRLLSIVQSEIYLSESEINQRFGADEFDFENSHREFASLLAKNDDAAISVEVIDESGEPRHLVRGVFATTLNADEEWIRFDLEKDGRYGGYVRFSVERGFGSPSLRRKIFFFNPETKAWTNEISMRWPNSEYAIKELTIESLE